MSGRKKILITLSSGLADLIHCPSDVDLVIVDRDKKESVPAVCYQPEHNETEWEKLNFACFMVYKNRRNAQLDFPSFKIIEYKTDQIQEPIFID
jgi:predicted nucleotidyltransferase